MNTCYIRVCIYVWLYDLLRVLHIANREVCASLRSKCILVTSLLPAGGCCQWQQAQEQDSHCAGSTWRKKPRLRKPSETQMVSGYCSILVCWGGEGSATPNWSLLIHVIYPGRSGPVKKAAEALNLQLGGLKWTKSSGLVCIHRPRLDHWQTRSMVDLGLLDSRKMLSICMGVYHLKSCFQGSYLQFQGVCLAIFSFGMECTSNCERAARAWSCIPCPSRFLLNQIKPVPHINTQPPILCMYIYLSIYLSIYLCLSVSICVCMCV